MEPGCDAAGHPHGDVARAAVGVDGVAACGAATKVHGDIARPRPGSDSKVSSLVGQNDVHVAPGSVCRYACDGQAGQVKLDVAAIAVSSDIGRDGGIKVDLP